MHTMKRLVWGCVAMVMAASACEQVLGFDQDFQPKEGAESPTCDAARPCDDENPCTTDTCNAEGKCEFAKLNGVSTPGYADTAGDCASRACINGTDTLVTDDLDVVDDGNDCTLEACTDGKPSPSNATYGTACNQNNGTVCNGAGECKLPNGDTCSASVDCASTHCIEGVCCDADSCIGGSCATGACSCPGTVPLLCAGVCRKGENDDANCGACNVGCSADSTGINTCSNANCTNRSWSGWPMPNPPITGLPNPSSYNIEFTDGIVTDNVTGLLWQRDLSATAYTWVDAKDYCANLDYGGFDDWRLPTRIELTSLVDFTKPSPGPTIDTTAFANAPNDWFWTSSPWAADPSRAWYVNFATGHTLELGIANVCRVRCVR